MASCQNPNLVYLDGADVPEGDSRLVRFLGRASSAIERGLLTLHDGIVNPSTGELDRSAAVPVLTPCGRCPACLANKAGEFALRCYLENKMQSDDRITLFLTMTYDGDNVPFDSTVTDPAYNGSLNYDHPRYFLKDLRDYVQSLIYEGSVSLWFWVDENGTRFFGSGVRYMFTGEYGDKTHRPHYHCILFGFPKILCDDFRPAGSRNGKQYYTSDFLGSLWGRGQVIIGSGEFGSAFYTASYSQKKTFSLDDFIIGRPESKSFYSLRPGIGYTYFYQNILPEIQRNASQGIYDAPTILLDNGRYCPMPQYFWRRLRLTNPDIYDKMKVQNYYSSFFEFAELLNADHYNGIDADMHKNAINNSSKINRIL